MTQSIDCIAYTRVSTERQAGEERTSIADQEAAITRRATQLGRTVGRWYRDAGASGATIEKRPAFCALMEFCEQHRRAPTSPGLVLVLNDSRFGRFPDPDQAAAVRFQLKQLGWIVRFCEGDETEDVTFRSVMRAIGSAQASEYRRNIQRNAQRGAFGTAEQGYWPGREPLGYRRRVVYPADVARTLESGQQKAPKEKVKLTLGPPDEVEIVRWIFSQYAAGAQSLGTLARELPARYPAKRWSRRTVQAVLQNRAYVGDVVWGRRPADAEARRHGIMRALHECAVHRGAHEAIVDRMLFERVQDRLGINKRQTRAATGGYALSGIMRCTHCGDFYIGGGGGRGPKGSPGPLRFYKCRIGVYHPERCPGPIGTITRSIVESAVVNVIAQELTTPKAQLRISQAVRKAVAESAEQAPAARQQLERELGALEAKRNRLVERVADGTLRREEAAEALAGVRAEIDRTKSALERLRFVARGRRRAGETLDRVLALAQNFPAVAATLHGAALRELLRPWLHDLTFDKVTRMLTLRIRRLPDVMDLNISRRQGERKEIVTRRISLRQKRIGQRIVAGGR